MLYNKSIQPLVFGKIKEKVKYKVVNVVKVDTGKF